MTARGRGDGDESEARVMAVAVDGEIGSKELLGVDGVVEGEARELEVDADEDTAVGGEADGGDWVGGDGRASQGLCGLDEGWEERYHGREA